MEIIQLHQYNQSIGKSKILSSTAGVGSIITTKLGYYILISDINKWKFLNKSHHIVKQIREQESDELEWYNKSRKSLNYRGHSVINDQRFVEFLRTKDAMGLDNLVCLISIPDMSINDIFNTPNWKTHPIAKRLKDLDEESKPEEYMIMGTHFPKWFVNSKKKLKKYQEWKSLWSKNPDLNLYSFVPPRDSTTPVKKANGDKVLFKVKDKGNQEKYIPLHKKLKQTNLILICPNGHLSDIPWSRFLRWKSERTSPKDIGGNLFNIEKCCPSPDLEWSESTTKSEGYGSVFIECKSCGLGGEGNKINLEGINNLKPLCKGEKPWEISLSQDSEEIIPYESCQKSKPGKCRECNDSHSQPHMRVSLVTGNSVYFANGFSSLFIPQYLASNTNPLLLEAIKRCESKYERYLKALPNTTKEEYWNNLDLNDFLIDNELIQNGKTLIQIDALKNTFLKEDEILEVDSFEEYRWQEYQCFTKNETISISEENSGLSFRDIELNEFLNSFFKKIQQVEDLKVTQVQMGFSRVRPKERIIINNKVEETTEGKNIYSIESDEVFVLPANESLGEGLFFQFNEEKIEKWTDLILNNDSRFSRFFENQDLSSQFASAKQKIKNNGFKHFLIHSFSHMLMRELEFSCGYPTASLKERLYISNNPERPMSGVLIYTAEGSEGSMGGLVWQGQPERITDLIKKGIERTTNCSSDPLCWESSGQGIYDLNLAACFSCSLVSETACEEWNLGLDRRVLVDPEFGFFKDFQFE